MSMRKWISVVIPAGLLFGLMLGWLTAVAANPVYPRIDPDPKGWMPVCPSGMDVARHVPPPDCFWGKKPISLKPTRGDFECVYIAQATQLPACPAE